MGRQPNAPKLTAKGTYECWHPGVKRRINLGVSDYNEALRIQAGFYGSSVQPSVPSLGATSVPAELGNPPVSSDSPGNGPPMSILDLDSPDKPLDASNLLSSWASTKGGASSTSATVTPTASPATPAPVVSLFAPKPLTGGNTGPKPKPGLTPEQSAKLAAGLKKIVTNLNVILVGAGVEMFGRVPAPLDDEEVQLLQMGWEMFIDEMFVKAKVKPWHVLLAGNVMVGAAMYVGGTPKPKKPALPPGDPTKAKSAMVTPIDGGKSNG